jgi:ketosteroid isomerase-like protein
MAMPATATSVVREIKELEQRYWDATMAADGTALKQLTAENFTFVMPAGINQFKRDEFVKMMSAGDFKLTSFKFDRDKATVRELGDSAALIAYRVKWTYEREGKEELTDTYYTSMWVREGRDWKYAAACETPLEAKG